MVDVPAIEKRHLLRDLSICAASRLEVKSNVIARELLKRERLGSTGLGDGVAIPHARIPGLGKPFGMLLRLRQSIEFEAIDDQPVDLVFLLLLMTGRDGDQLTALASIARRMRDPGIVKKLRAASSETALY